MNKVLEEFSKIGIIPVIALDHVEDAAPLAKALCDGGLPCAEVTFRTAAAEEHHVRAVPGDVSRRRYRSYYRAG